jgi:serine/threonine protein kinase
MYTPGFAAPELYRRNQQLGPWTDIYGLGASMYACMIGAPPQPADQRNLHDKIDAGLQSALQLYSQPLVDIVHWCLKQNPLERPQSVFALQRALRDAPTAGVAAPAAASPPAGFARWLDGLAGRRRRPIRRDTTLIWPTHKASS